MTSLQDGLTQEKSGNYDLAQAIYQQEIAEGRATKDSVRGLFRTTIRVGDISLLVLTLPELSQIAGINHNSSNLMQARLHIEIGQIEESRKLTAEIDVKHLGQPETSELALLKADILASEFRFQEALEVLNHSPNPSINILRRIAEIELALHKPMESISSLKRYVSELNNKNKISGDSKRFITASGAIFNLANQIWLEQKFPGSEKQLSLSQSMKVLVEHCKLTSGRINLENQGNLPQKNFEIGEISTPKQSALQPKADLDLSEIPNKRPDNVDLLIKFTQENPANREYSSGLAREWEAKYVLANEHFFAIEESGLALATNFRTCSMCIFLPEWHGGLLETKAAGRKSHLPHLSPGGSLTKHLAEMIQESPIHSPTIIHRSRVRAFRYLPGRYSN